MNPAIIMTNKNSMAKLSEDRRRTLTISLSYRFFDNLK
jgi:hypothetical protein